MGRRFFDAAGLPGKFDPVAFSGLAAGLMGRDDAALFISGGGMIGGVLAPSYAAPGHVMAVEMFWWSEDGEGKALLAAFEGWAASKGAGEVRMTALSGLRGKAVGRALERAGYKPVETSYGKAL